MPSSDGFKLFLVLAYNPATPSFTFTLNSPGMTPALQADGSIVFTDKTGTVVGTMPQPYAIDSTVNPLSGRGLYTDQVSYALAVSGTTNLLTLNVDPTWLGTAVYPVYVDPSIIVSGTAWMVDTFIDHAYPTGNYNGWTDSDGIQTMDLGYNGLASPNPNYPGRAEYCYALMFFSLPADVMGSTIQNASLAVYPHHGWVTTAKSVTFDRITTSWSAARVTWNTAPSSTTLGSQAFKQGTASSFGVASTVQDWANGATNYGFLLHTSTTDDTYWKRLTASEQADVNIPKLNITYTRPVVTPTSPTGGAWTSSRVLDWDLADVGGKTQTSFSVVVATNPAFTSPILTTGTIAGVNTNYVIPGTTALTGTPTYYWEVRGYNGSEWSVWASSSFRWDENRSHVDRLHRACGTGRTNRALAMPSPGAQPPLVALASQAMPSSSNRRQSVPARTRAPRAGPI